MIVSKINANQYFSSAAFSRDLNLQKTQALPEIKSIRNKKNKNYSITDGKSEYLHLFHFIVVFLTTELFFFCISAGVSPYALSRSVRIQQSEQKPEKENFHNVER